MISALHLESGDGYYAVGIASIAFNAVMFVCTTLLLLTALQDKKPKRLLPWLVFEFIGLILAFSSLLYGFYHILYTFLVGVNTKTLIFFVFTLFGAGRLFEFIFRISLTQLLKLIVCIIVVGVYFWFVVYSYYKKLTSRARPQQLQM